MRTLRAQIEDILNKDHCRCKQCNEAHAIAILKAIQDRLPEIKKAHTYASENADDYRLHDSGQEDYRTAVLKVLGEA